VYVDYERKVAFFGVPRTGTRTVRDVLTDQYGFETVGNHHSTPGSQPNNRWPDSSGFYDQHLRHGGWTTFCFVRNHFDRMASFWRLTQENAMPDLDPESEDTKIMLRKIVRNTSGLAMGQGNARGFMYMPWTQYATHVLRFENLAHDLTEFLRVAGYDVSDIVIPHVGAIETSNRRYRDYFNELTRKKLEYKCSYEMLLYGYSW
jgi:hypothetical protein